MAKDRASPAKAAAVPHLNGDSQPEVQTSGLPASSMPDELMFVPLKAIASNPLNPRKTFDQAKLEELAASIRDKGVLEPVILRPHPQAGAKANVSYQVVAGERRIRAAAIAGLQVIPALVRGYGDRACLEVMVIENEQRDDVRPLEKAEGYHELTKLGVKPDEIAKRVGKSESTIYGLLALLKLPDKARKALEKGELSPAVAGLIARVPGEEDRKQATKDLTSGWGDNGPSFREAKEYIEEHYVRELKSAPFDRKSLELVPSAGSCDQCPKRVGNLQKVDPDGYAGFRGDGCTDPACYQSKVTAWQEQETAAAEKEGKTVLSGKESGKLFGEYAGGHLKYEAPYFDLAGRNMYDSKSRTYEQLVGKELADKTVLAFDHNNQLHKLVPKADANKVLKEKEIPTSFSSGGRNGKASPAEVRRRAEEKIKSEVNRRCIARLVENAEQIFDDAVSNMLVTKVPLLDVIKALIPGVASELWHETLKGVLQRRGKEASGHDQKDKSLKELTTELTGAKLFGLLAELGAAKMVTTQLYGREKDTTAILDAFNVDKKSIEKEVRAEKKAAKK